MPRVSVFLSLLLPLLPVSRQLPADLPDLLLLSPLPHPPQTVYLRRFQLLPHLPVYLRLPVILLPYCQPVW